MRLVFDVTGVERVESHFMAFHRRLGSPREGFEETANYLRSRQRRRFASRGEGSWPANRPGTVRQKGHARVLMMTGALERSLTTRGGGNVQRISGQTMTFGTSRFYARFVAKRRRLFNTTGQDRRHVGSLFMRFFLEPFAR